MAEIDRIERNTHLLDWLQDGHTHCQHGTKEWCEAYLHNARAVITAQDAEIARLRGREEEYRKALAPFYAVAKELPDPRLINDEAPGVLKAHLPAFKVAVGKLTLGNFRRVFWLMEARALSPTNQKGDQDGGKPHGGGL